MHGICRKVHGCDEAPVYEGIFFLLLEATIGNRVVFTLDAALKKLHRFQYPCRFRRGQKCPLHLFLERHVHQLLGLKPRVLGVHQTRTTRTTGLAYRSQFSAQVSSFQVNTPLGKPCCWSSAIKGRTHSRNGGHFGDRPADHKIKGRAVGERFRPGPGAFHIFRPKRLRTASTTFIFLPMESHR